MTKAVGGVPVCGRRGWRPSDEGVTFIELVVVLCLIAVLTALAVPVTAQAIDAGRARQAAGVMASRFRMARQQAVFQSAAVAIVFDQIDGRWTFRVCVDGNGNGLRRTEIGSGTDTCPDGPHDLATLFPGMAVAVDPRLPGPDGTASTADPVRFGSSDMASFSPEGSGTAGTLFLRSARGGQFAVRVAGITGRTRILRYDAGSRTWVAG